MRWSSAPGDARKRLFVVEQHAGRDPHPRERQARGQAVLQIDRKLSTGNEQGLLGLAFHPDFAKNGKLYVNYTADDKDTHIVEYKVVGAIPTRST